MNRILFKPVLATIVLLFCISLHIISATFSQGTIYVEYGVTTTVTLPDNLISEYNNYSAVPYNDGGSLSWSVSNNSLVIEWTANFSCHIRPRSGSVFPSQVKLTAQFYSWHGTTMMDTKAEWTVVLKDNSGSTTTPDSEFVLPEDNWTADGNYDIRWFDKSLSEFTIYTNKELAGLSYLVNSKTSDFKDKTVKLGANVDMRENKWCPIGVLKDYPFKGTFDGQNHRITGLDMGSLFEDQRYFGFFGCAEDATVKNVKLVGNLYVVTPKENVVYFSGGSYVVYLYIGGLAGSFTGNVEHVKCEVPVTYYTNVSTTSTDCDVYIGGLIGEGKGTVSHCIHIGDFECTITNPGSIGLSVPEIGGIVGHFGGIVEFCENESDFINVSIPYNVKNAWSVRIGGIMSFGMGSIKNSISYCKSTIGNISITDGGFKWSDRLSCSCYIGGIICLDETSSGYNRADYARTYVSNCYSAMQVTTINSSNANIRFYYGGISTYDSSNAYNNNFSNVDATIQNTITKVRGTDGVNTFSSLQMQTSAFLEELNAGLYQLVWAQEAEGGYPYIVENHSTAEPENVLISTITLSSDELLLDKDVTYQLLNTISPENATVKRVSWSSSDENVAVVDDSGMVKTLSYGKAVITCTADDGSGISSTCSVSVVKPDNWLNSGNYDLSWFNKNKSEFTLFTAEEFAGMAYLVNNGYTDFYGKSIKIAADIDLGGKVWIPCNIFRGKLDGGDHTISGINIKWEQSTAKANDTIFVGVWKKIYDAEIKNLSFQGKSSVSCIHTCSDGWGYYSIGGISGEMKHSIIDRCTNSIDIKVSCARRSTSYCYSVGCIGGLIGRAPNANKTAIRYCKNTGQLHFAGDVSVAQRSFCGGIIGYGNIPIEYCENTPSLPFVCEQDATYDDVYIGGIAGQGGDSDILCCRSVMDSVVISKCRDAMIGGIDAMRVSAYEDKIKNCYSYIGKIHVKDENSGTLYYGGILSRAYDFNTSGPKASFSNNDVEIVTGKQIEGVHDGSTSFSSSQMQTTAFLDELNMFSMFEMEGPKWTMPDNVGFPYIAEFYQTSAVRDIRTIRNSNATPIYNLRGQRLASPQKGIDIIDGKKVVVK